MQSRFMILALAASVACLTNGDAQAQDSARGPEIGARVRVFAPDLRTDRYIGRIKSLDVSGGRTARNAAMRGAVFGMLVGGLLFGLGSMPEVNPDANDFMRGVPVGLAVGAIGGAVIGFGIGGERWLPARVPR